MNDSLLVLQHKTSFIQTVSTVKTLIRLQLSLFLFTLQPVDKWAAYFDEVTVVGHCDFNANLTVLCILNPAYCKEYASKEY